MATKGCNVYRMSGYSIMIASASINLVVENKATNMVRKGMRLFEGAELAQIRLFLIAAGAAVYFI
jgi:hypothetical protein